MIVRELEAGEEPIWDEFVRRSPELGIYARTGWKRVLERTYDHGTRYLMAKETGEVHGVLPLLVVQSRLFGGYVTSLPGGISAVDARVAKALLKAAVDITDTAEVDYLVLRDGCRPWNGDLITSEHHCTLVLDLPAAPQQLWDSFPSTVRNRVRKAQKAGLSVTVGGKEHVDAFYRVFSYNMRDLGTPVFGKALIRNVASEFPQETRILLVQREGQPIGGMFLLKSDGLVHNPWVSSMRDFFDLCPNDLLYWEALRWACEQGCRRFDLGRSQWHSGTFRFKAKWGAEPQPLYYQYYLRRGDDIPDPAVQLEEHALYRAARWAWQRLPVAVTRIAGPPIVKYANPLG